MTSTPEEPSQSSSCLAGPPAGAARRPACWAACGPACRSPWFWPIFFCLVTVAVTINDSHILSAPDRFQTYRAKWQIRNDFTTFSLAAAYALRRGENPYDTRNAVVFPEDVYPEGGLPDRSVAAAATGRGENAPWNERPGKSFNYFPLNAVVLLPFTFLPVPLAQALWFALDLMLLIWALRAHGALAGGGRVGLFVWAAALAVALRFFLDNLALGQWNLPVYNLTVLGLWLIVARRMPWRGGLLVGLAAGLKFMPAGFVLYFAARRQWRAAAAILVAMLFWVLVFPTLMLGPARHLKLLKAYEGRVAQQKRNMIGSDHVPGHSLLATLKVYLSPTGRGGEEESRQQEHINVANLRPPVAERVAQAVCAVLAIVTLIACLPGGAGAAPGRRTLVELGLWFMLYLLVSPEVRKAQMLTTFTAAFALGLCWADAALPAWRRRLAGGALVAGFVLVVLSSGGLWGSWHASLVLHGSYTLFLLVFWGALLALRATERAIGSDGLGTAAGASSASGVSR